MSNKEHTPCSFPKNWKLSRDGKRKIKVKILTYIKFAARYVYFFYFISSLLLEFYNFIASNLQVNYVVDFLRDFAQLG